MLWKIVSTGKRIVDINGYSLKPYETIIVDPTTMPSYIIDNILSYQRIGLIKIYEQEVINTAIEEIDSQVEPEVKQETVEEPTVQSKRTRKNTNKGSEE